MGCLGVNGKAILCSIAVICCVELCTSQYNHNQQPQQKRESVYNKEINWPVTLSFHETKTNAMLGEALLKRIYARIGFSDNIIRAEVDTLFENLKEVIEKRLRKCERKRRRAGNVRGSPYETLYGHMNATLSKQYTPSQQGQGRTRSQGTSY